MADRTVPRIAGEQGAVASARETSPKPGPLLSATKLEKLFPGVTALQGVDVEVFPGEIQCWIGENGAGKSTLIKVFAGYYQKDSGTTSVNGLEVDIEDPIHSLSLGMSFILQELSVVPGLTVMDNILLGHEVSLAGNVLRSRQASRAKILLESIGFGSISPRELVASLSVAEQQAVMVARALHLDANVIFFDETTASLGAEEAQKIFKVMEKIKGEGKAVVFVTHRLDEVMRVADRVTVFKDGEIVESGLVSEFSMESMVTKMVGREISNVFPEKDREPSDVVLELVSVTTQNVQNVSFTLRRGEVVALAGLVGSGRTEVLESIFGLEKLSSGEIRLKGQRLNPANPVAAINAGIGLVPEDRRSQGIVALRSVEENLPLSWAGRTEKKDWRKKGVGLAKDYIDKMAIRTPSQKQLIGLLSGGNQQKVVVSRWLATNPKVLLLDEPTRGIDVGAKSEMYRLIDSLARGGLAILLVSSEMTEVLGLADRILVMRRGQIAGELDGSTSEEEVLKLAMLEKETT